MASLRDASAAATCPRNTRKGHKKQKTFPRLLPPWILDKKRDTCDQQARWEEPPRRMTVAISEGVNFMTVHCDFQTMITGCLPPGLPGGRISTSLSMTSDREPTSPFTEEIPVDPTKSQSRN